MKKPSEASVKKLFALSGNKCSYPSCETPIIDKTSGVILGKICHIKAASKKGPRFDPKQSDIERHDYNNLILLCGVHHDVIDKNIDTYDVIMLEEMKKIHESLDKKEPKPEDAIFAKMLLNNFGTITIKKNTGHIHADKIDAVNADKVTVKTTKSNVHIMPPLNSIGNNSSLKHTIEELLDKIGDERSKRFGPSAYGVLRKKFKKDFGIKTGKYTVIYTWPEECADSIISYLQNKFNNTIRGRKENATTKNEYIPTRPQLYAKETSLLEQFGLNMKSDWVKGRLKRYFQVESHTKLGHIEHWRFVISIENELKKKIGE